MAVKKTQMYRKNLDTSETNLYPLTEAQYVSMENGQTVQEILSDRDSDKYTPVITNSSSTFKVGQGDNVDLSSSMKEGAYDSCVLKGKTMVNCIQESSSKDVVLPYEFEEGQSITINDTKESGALGVELKGQTLVNLVPKMNNSGNESSLVYITEDEIKISEDSTAHRQMYWTSNEVLSKFKTNTTYTVIANITENTLTSAFMLINAYASVGGDIASAALCVPVNFTGRFVGVFRTVSDFTNRTRLGFNAGAGSEGKLTMKNDMVILEGDWTNQELPFDSFFTGMASCKMPILSTTGKNLLPSIKNTWYPCRFKQGTTFKLSTRDSVPSNGGNVVFKDINGASVWFSIDSGNTTSTKVLPCDVYYIMNSLATGVEHQLEIGTQVTSYEPNKTSILSLPEEVVLRSLPNGVCDTFNTRTGVYTQRIGEVVLDGRNYTGFSRDSGLENDTTCKYFISNFFSQLLDGKGGQNEKVVLNCDGLPSVSFNTMQDKTLATYPCIANSGAGSLNLRVKKDLNSTALLLTHLQSNPLRIQYPLATPIVTKINLSSTLKSWNTTTHIYSEIPENTLYPTLSHSNPTYPVILKPSTKYSIVANSYSNSHTNSTINFNLGGATASTVVGNRVTTITTPSALSNELLTMSGRGNKLNNVMVIEGDVVGDEPYFEGICDCKSPILSNVGKNLWNIPSRAFDGKNYTVPSGNGYYGCKIMTLPRGTYFVKATLKNNDIVDDYMYFGITNFSTNNNGNHSFNVFYITGKGYNTNITNGFKIKITSDFQDIYLWSTSKASPSIQRVLNCLDEVHMELTNEEDVVYEPYKSNITTFEQKDGKTIVLRSLPSGVCDTLNVETGEYVQRIGEVVLDGSYIAHSNQSDGGYPSATSTAVLLNLKSSEPPQNRTAKFVCKELPHYSANNSIWMGGTPVNTGISGVSGAWDFCIRLPYTVTGGARTDSNDVVRQKFKDYLNENPVTVQYELKTPVVRTIDIQGFPYAYKDGYVQLTSGHSGQSLTPKVEYSLSANKTGQINSNTKRVSAHQKQLDDFEAMMLTSMVQSAYDKAILQFDYEMQMMSLGGE